MSSPSAFHRRGPGRYRVDVGYLLVFIVVLGVLGGVAYHIYSSTRVNVDDIEWPDPLSLGRSRSQQRLVQAVGNVQGPIAIPTATATAAAQAAPAAAPQPQVAPTRVPPSSIPLAALERAIMNPNDAASATQPPPAAAGATPQPTAAANQGRMKIANTGGDGVFVRRTPKMSDRLVAWPDNTPMEFLGETADGDGQKWSKVRDPRGNVGWVPTQYLGPDQSQPSAPAPAAAPAPAVAGPVRPAAPPPPAPQPAAPQPARNP